MFARIMVFFGLGPVQRMITARLRSRIREAEQALVLKHNELDSAFADSMEALQRAHELNKGMALDAIVEGLLK